MYNRQQTSFISAVSVKATPLFMSFSTAEVFLLHHKRFFVNNLIIIPASGIS